MARSRRKKISALGILAIAAGGVAWYALQTGRLEKGAVFIGAVGLMLALLAVLGSMLIGNTGKFVPFLGLLACGSVAGFGISHEGTRVQVVDQLKQWEARFKPAPVIDQKPAPAPVVAAPAPVVEKPVGSGTIFDMTPGSRGSAPSPNASGASQGAAPPPPAPAAVTAAPSFPAALTPSATQRYSEASAAVSRARAKVEAATAGLLPALSQTPAYQSAKSELDAADAALNAARANGDPGNPELVATAQRYINAKTALQKVISAAAEVDPDTVAAKQELIEAQGELKAARADTEARRK